MKIHFASFADTKYAGTLLRIRSEAQRSGFFDEVHTYDQTQLDADFHQRHHPFMQGSPVGYGYWIWKPQVCLQTFAQMAEGDILVYADAGCTINPKARARFDQWIEMTVTHGSLSFQTPHLERQYTKGDLLELLTATAHGDTPQLMATVLLLRKCKATQTFLAEWLSLCEDYDLISDSPSRVKNSDDFVQHRRDQSIASLLRKMHGFHTIPDETWHHDWSQVQHVPILATRLKF